MVLLMVVSSALRSAGAAAAARAAVTPCLTNVRRETFRSSLLMVSSRVPRFSGKGREYNRPDLKGRGVIHPFPQAPPCTHEPHSARTNLQVIDPSTEPCAAPRTSPAPGTPSRADL